MNPWTTILRGRRAQFTGPATFHSLAAGSLRFLALFSALVFAFPISLRAETMYGDFPESHVFEPPIYVIRVSGNLGRYLFLKNDPQGRPVGVDFVVADRVHYYDDYVLLGGPFYTPAEAAAVVPQGAVVTDTSQEKRFFGRSPAGASPGPATIPPPAGQDALEDFLRIPAVRFAIIALVFVILAQVFNKLTPKTRRDPETPDDIK